MVVNMLLVLDSLDHQERGAQQHGQDEHDDQKLAVVGLSEEHTQRHRQTADDQHDRVDGAESDVLMMAGSGKCLVIAPPIEPVSQEQSAEKENLGGQENPHSECGRLLLLTKVIKMMRQRGVVMMSRDVGHPCFPPLAATNWW